MAEAPPRSPKSGGGVVEHVLFDEVSTTARVLITHRLAPRASASPGSGQGPRCIETLRCIRFLSAAADADWATSDAYQGVAVFSLEVEPGPAAPGRSGDGLLTTVTLDQLIDGRIASSLRAESVPMEYERILVALAARHASEAGAPSAFFGGLGAGTVPRVLSECIAGLRVTACVERDAGVAGLARALFAFPAALPVVVDDALRALAAALPDSLGLIVVDISDGESGSPARLSPPPHLDNALRRAAWRALHPHGALLVNVLSRPPAGEPVGARPSVQHAKALGELLASAPRGDGGAGKAARLIQVVAGREGNAVLLVAARPAGRGEAETRGAGTEWRAGVAESVCGALPAWVQPRLGGLEVWDMVPCNSPPGRGARAPARG